MIYIDAIKQKIEDSSEEQLRSLAKAMLLDLLAYESVCKDYATFGAIHDDLVENFERYLSNVHQDSSSV